MHCLFMNSIGKIFLQKQLKKSPFFSEYYVVACTNLKSQSVQCIRYGVLGFPTMQFTKYLYHTGYYINAILNLKHIV